MDRECSETVRETRDLEQRIVQLARQINGNGKPLAESNELSSMMTEVVNLRTKAKQRFDRKNTLAANVLLDVDRFIKKLDTDLAFFETDLRGCGEFEQLARSVEPGSDVSRPLP